MLVPAAGRSRVDALARAGSGARRRGDAAAALHAAARDAGGPRSPRVLAGSAARARRPCAGLGAGRGARPSPRRAARRRRSSPPSPSLALGNLVRHETIGFGRGAPAQRLERGTAMLDKHFPPGLELAAAAVVTSASGPRRGRAARARAGRRLRACPRRPRVGDSRSSRSSSARSVLRRGGGMVRRMRNELGRGAPGASVGGIPPRTSTSSDQRARHAADRAGGLLVVVLDPVAVSLRALAAPGLPDRDGRRLVLRRRSASPRCSSRDLLGRAGSPSTSSLLSFIFLVALGVDYNIFLMSRAREEAAGHGTGEAMLARAA